jgi:hypothetical protein
MVAFDPESPCSVEKLLDRADEMMYLQKRAKKRNGGREPRHA